MTIKVICVNCRKSEKPERKKEESKLTSVPAALRMTAAVTADSFCGRVSKEGGRQEGPQKPPVLSRGQSFSRALVGPCCLQWMVRASGWTRGFGQPRAFTATAAFYPFSLVDLTPAWSEQHLLAAFSLEPNREAKSLF